MITTIEDQLVIMINKAMMIMKWLDDHEPLMIMIKQRAEDDHEPASTTAVFLAGWFCRAVSVSESLTREPRFFHDHHRSVVDHDLDDHDHELDDHDHRAETRS